MTFCSRRFLDEDKAKHDPIMTRETISCSPNASSFGWTCWSTRRHSASVEMLLRGGCTLLISELALLIVILHVHLYASRSAPSEGWPPSIDWLPDPIRHKIDPPNYATRLDWLDRIDQSPSIVPDARLSSSRIRGLSRSLLAKVEEPPFTKTRTIDLLKDSITKQKCCEHPLLLDVSATPSEPSDASYMIFGISKTLQRLNDTIPALLRWLPRTHAKLVVIVVEEKGKPANNK